MLKRAAIAFVLGALGCSTPAGTWVPPSPDPAMFEAAVYPILLSDCAFSGCHGDPARFFRVHGPGRTRLSADTPIYDPPTAQELALAYTRAASMLQDPEGPRRSPLLRKPLAVAVGGAGHAGVDAWGRNVYLTKRDPRWETLFFWALTAEAAPP